MTLRIQEKFCCADWHLCQVLCMLSVIILRVAMLSVIECHYAACCVCRVALLTLYAESRANLSTTTEARDQISTGVESLEFQKHFEGVEKTTDFK